VPWDFGRIGCYADRNNESGRSKLTRTTDKLEDGASLHLSVEPGRCYAFCNTAIPCLGGTKIILKGRSSNTLSATFGGHRKIGIPGRNFSQNIPF
jgi:hypothetical protein